MSSQGFQAHDEIPQEIIRNFGRLFEEYLPGWSVNGEYNFDVRPSSQMGAAQLNKLVHNGSHPYINRPLLELLQRFEKEVPEVDRPKRLAQLVNFLEEANDPTGAKTGGFVSYTSRRDPFLITDYGHQPSLDEMYAKAYQVFDWDYIKETPAGQEVEKLNVRLEFDEASNTNILKYEGKLDNGGFFSKTYDEIDQFTVYDTSSQSASTQHSAKYVKDENISTKKNGTVYKDGVAVDEAKAKAILNQTLDDGTKVSFFDKIPKGFSKLFGFAGTLLIATALFPSASRADQEHEEPTYRDDVHSEANKAFISEIFGQVVSGIAGGVAGTLAGLASGGLVAIPVASAAAIAAEPIGKWLGAQFYDLFPGIGNSMAEFLAPYVISAAEYVNEFMDALLELASEAFAYIADKLTQPDGLFGINGPIFGAGGPLEAVASFLQGKKVLSEDGIWLWESYDALLEGTDGGDILVHDGWGQVHGGAGDDVLLGWRAQYLQPGDQLFEGDAGALATRTERLLLDGGKGDDWVFAVGGQRAITVGGAGKDWIVNRTDKGTIYGDTPDGLLLQSPDDSVRSLAEHRALDTPENRDIVWWAPRTAMWDPGKHDTLEYWGMPLVGGSNDLPFALTRGVAGVAGATYNVATLNSPLFYDQWFPWMGYFVFDDNTLAVMNVFANAFGLFSKVEQAGGDKDIADGIMLLKNFQYPNSTAWAGHFYDPVPGVDGLAGLFVHQDTIRENMKGSMGMFFKESNPALQYMTMIHVTGGMGVITRMLPVLDDVLTKTFFAKQLIKANRWEPPADPLIIDLAGNGLDLVALDESEVFFDIDGDFFKERTGWVAPEDGILVHDAGADGQIDSVEEMFGNLEQWGFDELRQHDANADGYIDVQDAIFAELEVWQDINQDGLADEDELTSLAELGVVSIRIEGVELDHTTPQGTYLNRVDDVLFDTGLYGRAYEAVFDYADSETHYAGEAGVPNWLTGAVVEARGFGLVTDLEVAMVNDVELAEMVQAVLPTMTEPDIYTLSAQAGDVLGHWGMTLNLTRELTPVLVESDLNGARLADRAIWIEDDLGGYWKLQSGTGVLDAQGAVIARPDMYDVMNQSALEGQSWQLEQLWSPATRGEALLQREAAPYLAEIVNDRVVVHDYGIQQEDGSWRLASGAPIAAADGATISSATVDDIIAMVPAEGLEWRVETFGHNPLAMVEVPQIGVYFINEQAVDFTVEMTDADGTFYVWARNLDRALEAQHKYGDASSYNLRNYEIDFATLDEVNSTDDSNFRVEIMTVAQFNFATSQIGTVLQPEMLAGVINDDATIDYSVNASGDMNFATDGSFDSGLDRQVQLVGAMMVQYIQMARTFGVRMAMEGGLGHYLDAIEYNTETAGYRALTDREMIPVFEAIFADMPTGYEEGYAYLRAWTDVLWQIYPDYSLEKEANLFGLGMTLDQRFIMQNMLPAWEATPGDLDLATALNALGVDETLLLQHGNTDTEVSGTSGRDLIYMSEGDQLVEGGAGSDVYYWSSTKGNDTIYDRDFGEADELRLTDIRSTEVAVRREGDHLYLSLQGGEFELFVRNQFFGEKNPSFAGDTEDTGLRTIIFADGVVWNQNELAAAVSTQTDGNDFLLGSGSLDVLRGGLGDDTLRGGAGGDIYIYERDGGRDVIQESNLESSNPLQAGLDFLHFVGDLTEQDVRLSRIGDGDDLIVTLLDADGNETADVLTIVDMFDGIRLNLSGFLADQVSSDLKLDFVAPNIIERFVFSDGASMDFGQITQNVVNAAKTDGDDVIYGFIDTDTLDGGAGNDVLYGREGADTYLYGLGYGLDIIEDDDASVKLFEDVKLPSIQKAISSGFGVDSAEIQALLGDENSLDDVLRFTDDIRWSDINFLRPVEWDDTLFLEIKGSDGDGVIINDFLKKMPFQGFFNRLEEIEFGDGTIWHWTNLIETYVTQAKTDGDDIIFGFSTADTIDGGLGDDYLQGQEGSDTYLLRLGEGNDTILDAGRIDTQSDLPVEDKLAALVDAASSNSDRAIFEGISSADVRVERDGLDLVLTHKATDQIWRFENQFVRDRAQGQAVEYFVFSDQTISFELWNPHNLGVSGTDASELLEGSNFAETIDGGQGNDTLRGGSDGDTYLFGYGAGNDVIEDVQLAASWNGRRGTEIETDDRIAFSAGITRDMVSFARVGDDLLITLDGASDSLQIVGQYADNANRIEWFDFESEPSLHVTDIEEQELIANATRGDNVIRNDTDSPMVLDGREGDDTLVGGTAQDIYSFGLGYDFDRIEEVEDVVSVVDIVRFNKGVQRDNLIIRRDGDDLLIDLGGGRDVLRIVDGLNASTVEEFHFVDDPDNPMTLEDIRDAMLVGSDGNDELIGFENRGDILDGGAGSDALIGTSGDDTYRFGFGGGQDEIIETGGIDTLEFGLGLRPGHLKFSDIDGDLLIEVAVTGESIVVKGGISETVVERFTFDDGTVLTMNDVRTQIIMSTPMGGANFVDASLFDTHFALEAEGAEAQAFTIAPGTGTDHIAMGADTRVVFYKGDGINFLNCFGATGDAEIVLSDYLPEEVRASVSAYTDQGYVLDFSDTGDRIIVGRYGGSATPDIVFADGTRWGQTELTKAVVEAQQSTDSDFIYGSNSADTIIGGTGDDFIHGSLGSDTYVYRRGDGHDILSETSQNAAQNIVQLVGYKPEDVSVELLALDVNEIVLRFNNEEDSLTLREWNSPNGSDQVQFSDGTVWLVEDLKVSATSPLDTPNVTGETSVNGTLENDVIVGGIGADTLTGDVGKDFISGGAGDDVYVFRAGDGQDTIYDVGGGVDTLEIHGYAAEDTTFSTDGINGENLILTFEGSDDRILIVKGRFNNTTHRVDYFHFADTGETLRQYDVYTGMLEYTPQTDGHDNIDSRSGTNKVYEGGLGDDRIYARGGGNEFLFSEGDGDDRIYVNANSGGDTLVLLDYNVEDILWVARTGLNGTDLVLKFEGERDRVTLERSLENNSYGVDIIRFSDGTEWSRDTLKLLALAGAQTVSDDSIRGFAGEDSLVGGPGEDTLSGLQGADTYTVSTGHSHTIINDGVAELGVSDRLIVTSAVSSETSVRRLFKGSDTVVLTFATTDEVITVFNALAVDGSGIEEITFSDGISWTATDLLGKIDNTKPEAVADGYFTAIAGSSLTIDADQLLANDYDPDGQELTVIHVDGGQNGVAELNADGDIVFTAAEGFTGATRLIYTVSDGQNGISSAIVDLRVRHQAEAQDDSGFSVSEDGQILIDPSRLLSNDLDGDRMVLGSVLDGENGTVSLTIEGMILFVPDPDFTGTASFRYIANTPEGGRGEARVSIDVVGVNDAPVATDDTGFATDEDEPLSVWIGDLLANDVDIDGDVLRVVDVTGTADLAVNLTESGFVEIIPAESFWGDASFTYTVEDVAGEQSTATVSVTVRPVNDAPIADDERFTTLEDTPLTFSVEDLLDGDTDAEGDTLQVTEVGFASSGTVSLSANGVIEFSPSINFNGEARFTYTVEDGQGGVSTGQVFIDVTPVDDLPVANIDSYVNNPSLAGLEDHVLEFSVATLLNNDSDPEDDDVLFIGLEQPVDGDAEIIDGQTVRFTPNPDFAGETTLYYRIGDSTGNEAIGSARLWFENIDDIPPTTLLDVVEVQEDVPQLIYFSDLLANDFDADGDAMRIIGWLPPVVFYNQNGLVEYLEAEGAFRFTPDANVTESEGFRYLVTDDTHGVSEGVIQINMIASDDDPTAVDNVVNSTSFDVPLIIRIADLMADDFDVDETEIAFNGVVSSTAGSSSIYNDEFIVVRFDAGFTGNVSVEYSIIDPTGLTGEAQADSAVIDSYSQVQNGTADRDLLIGNVLNETLSGGDGDDDLFGEAGDDLLIGDAGSDLLQGGDGNDTLRGGEGSDDLRGGVGVDFADYSASNAAVSVDLISGLGAGGTAQGDFIAQIENLTGSSFDDRLFADDGANLLEGGAGSDSLEGRDGSDTLIGDAGDDILVGGAGADSLDGGDGRDLADYTLSDAPIEVNLGTGVGVGGDAQGDTLSSVEDVLATAGNDVVVGDDQANYLRGSSGDDTIAGGEGADTISGGSGADVLDGGAGYDMLDYRSSISSVHIDFASGMGTGGAAEGDQVVGFEAVHGSTFGDVLIGDSGDNTIYGWAGADTLEGGEGHDVLDYTGAESSIAVDLTLGAGTAGDALGDVISGFEEVHGTDWNDTITGGSVDEIIDAGRGNDLLSGALGSDTYHFGFLSGSDTIVEAGQLGDTDRIQLQAGVEARHITLLREDDDLIIELDEGLSLRQDTLRISNHFSGEANGIEQIVFDDGTVWAAAEISDRIALGSINANDDQYLVAREDLEITFDVAELLRNDSDNQGVDLTIVAVSAVSGGVPTLHDDGRLTFLGEQDFNGKAYFDYVVEDAIGRQSTARVEVVLAAVNDAPTTTGRVNLVAIEDTPLTIDYDTLFSVIEDVDLSREGDTLRVVGLAPLLDDDGNPIGVFSHNALTYGDASGGPTGISFLDVGSSFEFEPIGDYFGFAGFEFTVADAAGATTTAEAWIQVEAVNDAPVSQLDRFVVRLDKINIIAVSDILKNDSDVEGDAFEFIGLHSVLGGSATLIENSGSVEIDGRTITGDYIEFTAVDLGSASFTYDVADERGAQSSHVVDLIVKPLNDAPVATDDVLPSIVEDQILTFDVDELLANDTDANGDLLTVISVERFPEHGRVSLSDTGTITFSPFANFNGEAGFSYTISDGIDTDTAYVTIPILPDNDAPVLRDDLIWAVEDTGPISVIAADLFGNDFDPEGDVVDIDRASILGLIDDSYMTQAYAIRADEESVSALPDWLTFDEETLLLQGEMPNDYDGIVTFSFNADMEQHRGLANAIRELNSDEIDGELVLREGVEEYMSLRLGLGDTVYTAFETLTFTADDWEELARGVSLEEYFGQQSFVRSSIEVAQSFSSVLPEGAVITTTLADGSDLPDWLTVDGLQLTGTLPNGFAGEFDVSSAVTIGDQTFAWNTRITAADDERLQNGIELDAPYLSLATGASFTALAVSGNGHPLPEWLGFNAETLTFFETGVAPSDDQPTSVIVRFKPQLPDDLQLPDNVHVTSDGSVALRFVVDPNGFDQSINSLIQDATLFAEQGILVIPVPSVSAENTTLENGNDLPDWLSYDPQNRAFVGLPPAEYVGSIGIRTEVAATGDWPAFEVLQSVDVDRVFETGSSDGIDGGYGNDSMSIELIEDFNGAIAIHYWGVDSKGAVSEEPARLVVNVRPTPELPDAGADYFEGVENEDLTIALADLLLNDSDAERDFVRIIAVSQPESGSVEVITADQVIAAPALSIPDGGQVSARLASGEPLPSYVTAVDLSTGSITANLPLDIRETLDVLWEVTDGTGAVVYSVTGRRTFDGNEGASLVYTPAQDVFGDLQFSYTLTDTSEGSVEGQVSIWLKPVAEAPFAEDDSFSTNEDTPLVLSHETLFENDVDYDGQLLSLVSVFDPQNGAVTVENGNVIFTPDVNFTGSASFSYEVTDGVDGTDVARVTVDVLDANTAPVVEAVTYAGVEDMPYIVTLEQLMALASDADVEDVVTFVSLTPVDSNGLVSQMPGNQWQLIGNADVTGEVIFELAVTDGRLESVGQLILDLAPVNDAPEPGMDAITIEEGSSLVVTDLELMANDLDAENDPLSLVSVSDAFNGEVTLLDGVVTFIPREEYLGNGGFTYTVVDGQGGESTGHVQVTVVPAGGAPIVSHPGTQSGTEDVPFEMYIAADTISDPDGDPLTVSVMGQGATPLPVWLEFDEGALRLSGVPPQDFNGQIALELRVSDGSNTTVRSFTVEIAAVNDAPILFAPFSDRYGAEDTAFDIELQQNLIVDVDGDVLSYALTLEDGSPVPEWLVFDPVSLSISGMPPENFDGTIALRLHATDGVETVSDVFNLGFVPVNDAPVLTEALQNIELDADGEEISAGRSFVANVDLSGFADPDGDQLVFSVTLIDGAELPSWLSFDGATLFGTPPITEVGTISLRLSASDGVHVVSGDFDLVLSDPMREIHGTADADNLLGSEDGDIFFGYENNDRIVALGGNDTIYAGTSNDRLEGGDGDDQLFGEGGHDQLIGGAGNDLLDGGTGRDTYWFATGDGRDTVIGFEIGDKLFVNGVELRHPIQFPEGVTASDTAEGYEISYGQVGDAIILSGITAAAYAAMTPYVETGTDGDDYYVGADGADTLSGAAGDDTLEGAGGRDVLNGGDGNDSIDGGIESDTLIGDAGVDTLKGDTGNDLLEGGEGDDQLFGEGGHDKLLGGAGNDLLDGGTGRDTYWFATGDGRDTVIGFEIGDKLFVNGVELRHPIQFPEGVTASDTAEGYEISYGQVGDAIILSGITAAAYAAMTPYVETGTDGDDYYVGADGADTLSGAAGDDTLEGAGGRDVLNGGDGNDSLDAGKENDTLNGGDGADTLKGGTGNDRLYGDEGADQLFGEGGHDTLFGGAGDDLLDGGGGRDTIEAFNGGGHDTVIGFTSNDRLSINSVFIDDLDSLPESVSVSETASGLLFEYSATDSIQLDGLTALDFYDMARMTLSGGAGNDVLNGRNNNDLISGFEGNDVLLGHGRRDTISGGDGHDYIDGGTDSDRLSGGAGHDTLVGDTGNDNIEGGTGDDVIDAGHGNDFINGGAGLDALTGGKGRDSFYFSTGDGHDVITDFNPNDDRLFLDGIQITNLENLAANVSGQSYGYDYVLEYGQGDTVTLRWTAELHAMYPSLFPAQDTVGIDFDSADQFASFDDFTPQTIESVPVTVGIPETDILYGGTQKDIFTFEIGDGRDEIYGFQGTGGTRSFFIPGDEIRLSVGEIDTFDELLAMATETEGGVLFDFGNGDEIFLAGTKLAALDADQFTFY